MNCTVNLSEGVTVLSLEVLCPVTKDEARVVSRTVCHWYDSCPTSPRTLWTLPPSLVKIHFQPFSSGVLTVDSSMGPPVPSFP